MEKSRRQDAGELEGIPGNAVRFQRRTWRLQRAGWLAMLLVVAAAVAGIFGAGGALGWAAIEGRSGLRVGVERFARAGSPFELQVEISRRADGRGPVRLAIESAYLDRVVVEKIIPEPEAAEIGRDRIVFRFLIPADAPPGRVRFVLKAPRGGLLSGTVGVGDDRVAFRQLVYP